MSNLGKPSKPMSNLGKPSKPMSNLGKPYKTYVKFRQALQNLCQI